VETDIIVYKLFI